MSNPKIKAPESAREVMAELKAADVSVNEIAARTGWSRMTVYRALRSFGLVSRKTSRAASVRVLHGLGLSGAEIARRLGMHRTSVYEHLRRPAPAHNSFLWVCEHCGDTVRKKKGVIPNGWRRVQVADDCCQQIIECPDCSIAWDLEQMRRDRDAAQARDLCERVYRGAGPDGAAAP